MPNKHFCQGPDCHTRITQDRFLKSRGVIRGRYAIHQWTTNQNTTNEVNTFVVQVVSTWLDAHMESIEQGRPIEFIRHRRESGGYEKQTNEYEYGYREGTYTSLKLKGLTIGPN